MVRRAVADATAAGMFLRRHKLVASVALAFVLVAVGAGTLGFTALGSGTGGTSAPGSHQFYALGEENFCDQCHSLIRTELNGSAEGHWHQGSVCADCHAAGAGQHAASATKCVDCHADEAADLAGADEAHSGFYGSIGETSGVASWVCKACHTDVAITSTE